MKSRATASFVIALAIAFLLAQPGFAQEAIKSRVAAIVQSQQMIDAGDFEGAIEYLERANSIYPNDDQLLSLHGQALYESKRIREAEQLFRRALAINPLNEVAENYIQRIRETTSATISEQAAMFESVAVDKLGDIVVLALGFFLGSLMSRAAYRFKSRVTIRQAKRHFLQGEYNAFADLIEIQLAENNLKPLRESLRFMLQQKSLAESEEILSQYVNTEDSLANLLRMIRLNENHKH